MPYKTDRNYFCRYTNIMPYTADNDKVKYRVHRNRYYLLKGLEEMLVTSDILQMDNILLRINPVDPNGCKRTNFNRETYQLCK